MQVVIKCISAKLIQHREVMKILLLELIKIVCTRICINRALDNENGRNSATF